MSELPEIKAIDRIQENILARSERRLLNWLCARMPAGITPDRLTTIGMIGSVLVFAGYVLSNWDRNWLFLSIAAYFIQWFGDSLDGSLARFRKIERPRYGYFLDHSCDGLATTLIVSGIGLSPYVTLDAALFALAGYLLMSIHAFLAARVLGELRLSYLAFGPTELRFVLIALTLVMYFGGVPDPVIYSTSGLDLFVGAAGVFMIALFVAQTTSKVRLLARQEPPRR